MKLSKSFYEYVGNAFTFKYYINIATIAINGRVLENAMSSRMKIANYLSRKRVRAVMETILIPNGSDGRTMIMLTVTYQNIFFLLQFVGSY